MGQQIVYVLECENDKYYVGKTTEEPEDVLTLHTQGLGSTWTNVYKPISIIDVVESADPFDLDKTVKKYMALYGIDNVRGGSYLYNTLEEYEYRSIEKEIDTATERCYYCGNSGHYHMRCPYKTKDLEDQAEYNMLLSIEKRTFRVIVIGLTLFCFAFYFATRHGEDW